MNFFVKYLLPGVALTLVVFETCHRSSDKESKIGKAGDEFDLFAVMNTFQNSSSPESFEKSINSKSTGVNNLDLNEDGKTDYIKVVDKKVDDKSHVLILQVDVAANQTQDIATIEIQKSGENQAYVQIIGDEDLYGSDYIVEPKSDQAASAFVVATTYAVNVWAWPAVEFIYSPAYVVWESPYRYDYYPVWWEPWPVVVYDVYYPTVSVYRVNYAMSDGYRFVNVHENYHNNYRVTTRFNYHEKSYGSGEKINGKDNGGKDVSGKGNDKGDRKGMPGNDNGGMKHDGNQNGKSPGNDKRDVKPQNDNKSNKGGGGGHNDVSKPSGNDQRNAPKQNGKTNVPSGKSPAPSHPKQSNPKGGMPGGGGKQGGGGNHGGGGKGGGGKHR